MHDRRNFLRVSAQAGLLALGAAARPLRAITPSNESDLLTPNYSARDYEIVDYKFYSLPQIPRMQFRGPGINPFVRKDDFFTCIGAAQTEGVYVEKPFPTLVSEQIGLPVWNAGIGGANPAFFLRHREILRAANRGRFVVLQIMAARSEPNDRFKDIEGVEMVHDTKLGDTVRSPVAWQRVTSEEPTKLQTYLSESQHAWIEGYREILKLLKVPVLLFWFSPKRMDQPVDLHLTSGAGLMDRYPQFVDGQMVNEIRPLAKGFAACNSDRNTGHALISRFTGKPVEVDYSKLGGKAEPIRESHNVYYPSLEMHQDAARTLIASLQGNTPFKSLIRAP